MFEGLEKDQNVFTALVEGGVLQLFENYITARKRAESVTGSVGEPLTPSTPASSVTTAISRQSSLSTSLTVASPPSLAEIALNIKGKPKKRGSGSGLGVSPTFGVSPTSGDAAMPYSDATQLRHNQDTSVATPTTDASAGDATSRLDQVAGGVEYVVGSVGYVAGSMISVAGEMGSAATNAGSTAVTATANTLLAAYKGYDPRELTAAKVALAENCVAKTKDRLAAPIDGEKLPKTIDDLLSILADANAEALKVKAPFFQAKSASLEACLKVATKALQWVKDGKIKTDYRAFSVMDMMKVVLDLQSTLAVKKKIPPDERAEMQFFVQMFKVAIRIKLDGWCGEEGIGYAREIPDTVGDAIVAAIMMRIDAYSSSVGIMTHSDVRATLFKDMVAALREDIGKQKAATDGMLSSNPAIRELLDIVDKLSTVQLKPKLALTA